MTEYKECPFCGSHDLKRSYDEDRYFVRCNQCHAQGPQDFNHGRCDIKWNERNDAQDRFDPSLLMHLPTMTVMINGAEKTGYVTGRDYEEVELTFLDGTKHYVMD